MEEVSRENKLIAEEGLRKIESFEADAKLSRQPTDATSMDQIIDRIQRYPANKESAYAYLSNRLKIKGGRHADASSMTHIRSALIDEMQLVKPQLSRKQIKNLIKEKDTTIKGSGTEWMIEEISRARASRGKTNMPIVSPFGAIANSQVPKLTEISQRIQSFWREDIAVGEHSKVKTAHQMYREGQGRRQDQLIRGEVVSSKTVTMSKGKLTLKEAQAEAKRIARELGCN
jgi:hypothetical protein